MKTEAQRVAELEYQLAATRRAYLVSLILLGVCLLTILANGPWAS